MKNIVFILLLSYIFSFNSYSQLSVYETKPYATIEFNESSACACFELPDISKKGYTFYFQIICGEKGAKINKTLYYNFTEACDKNECDEKTYLYSNKNENLNANSEQNGFYYEYLFEVNGDDKKYLKIQYKDFEGKKVSMGYTPFSIGSILLTIFILFMTFLIIIIIIICCICRCIKKSRTNQENNREYNNNNVSSPIVPQENILNPQTNQYIELRKF